jgi:uncharacterized small protein (DUF1192 family)
MYNNTKIRRGSFCVEELLANSDAANTLIDEKQFYSMMKLALSQHEINLEAAFQSPRGSEAPIDTTGKLRSMWAELPKNDGENTISLATLTHLFTNEPNSTISSATSSPAVNPLHPIEPLSKIDLSWLTPEISSENDEYNEAQLQAVIGFYLNRELIAAELAELRAVLKYKGLTALNKALLTQLFERLRPDLVGNGANGSTRKKNKNKSKENIHHGDFYSQEGVPESKPSVVEALAQILDCEEILPSLPFLICSSNVQDRNVLSSTADIDALKHDNQSLKVEKSRVSSQLQLLKQQFSTIDNSNNQLGENNKLLLQQIRALENELEAQQLTALELKKQLQGSQSIIEQQKITLTQSNIEKNELRVNSADLDRRIAKLLLQQEISQEVMDRKDKQHTKKAAINPSSNHSSNSSDVAISNPSSNDTKAVFPAREEQISAAFEDSKLVAALKEENNTLKDRIAALQGELEQFHSSQHKREISNDSAMINYLHSLQQKRAVDNDLSSQFADLSSPISTPAKPLSNNNSNNSYNPSKNFEQAAASAPQPNKKNKKLDKAKTASETQQISAAESGANIVAEPIETKPNAAPSAASPWNNNKLKANLAVQSRDSSSFQTPVKPQTMSSEALLAHVKAAVTARLSAAKPPNTSNTSNPSSNTGPSLKIPAPSIIPRPDSFDFLLSPTAVKSSLEPSQAVDEKVLEILHRKLQQIEGQKASNSSINIAPSSAVASIIRKSPVTEHLYFPPADEAADKSTPPRTQFIRDDILRESSDSSARRRRRKNKSKGNNPADLGEEDNSFKRAEPHRAVEAEQRIVHSILKASSGQNKAPANSALTANKYNITRSVSFGEEEELKGPPVAAKLTNIAPEVQPAAAANKSKKNKQKFRVEIGMHPGKKASAPSPALDPASAVEIAKAVPSVALPSAFPQKSPAAEELSDQSPLVLTRILLLAFTALLALALIAISTALKTHTR